MTSAVEPPGSSRHRHRLLGVIRDVRGAVTLVRTPNVDQVMATHRSDPSTSPGVAQGAGTFRGWYGSLGGFLRVSMVRGSGPYVQSGGTASAVCSFRARRSLPGGHRGCSFRYGGGSCAHASGPKKRTHSVKHNCLASLSVSWIGSGARGAWRRRMAPLPPPTVIRESLPGVGRFTGAPPWHHDGPRRCRTAPAPACIRCVSGGGQGKVVSPRATRCDLLQLSPAFLLLISEFALLQCLPVHRGCERP